MAFTVDDHFYSEWQSAVQILQQQMGERMRPAVRVESATGEVHFFNQLAATTVQETATRHADTPIIEMDHRVRSVRPRFFQWSTIIDDEDKVRLLTDPTSTYNENASAAFHRKSDLVILEAAIGTSMTGEGGTTSTAFPAGQIVSSGGGGTGLTKAKLISTAELLMANEVQPPFYMAISANENADLLAVPEVASGDFNNDKPLVDGKVQSYMGFNFIHTEQLAVVSTIRHVIAWGKNSLLLAIWKNLEMNIAKDPTKNYNYRPHIKYFIGATRLDEVGVVRVDCA